MIKELIVHHCHAWNLVICFWNHLPLVLKSFFVKGVILPSHLLSLLFLFFLCHLLWLFRFRFTLDECCEINCKLYPAKADDILDSVFFLSIFRIDLCLFWVEVISIFLSLLFQVTEPLTWINQSICVKTMVVHLDAQSQEPLKFLLVNFRGINFVDMKPSWLQAVSCTLNT